MATPTAQLIREGWSQQVVATVHQPSRAANWKQPVSAPLRKTQEEGQSHSQTRLPVPVRTLSELSPLDNAHNQQVNIFPLL